MVQFSSTDMSSVPLPRPGSSASRPPSATTLGTSSASAKLNGAGILTPASAATLNRTATDPALTGDRKRKRATSIRPPSSTDNVLHDPIVLKVCPESPGALLHRPCTRRAAPNSCLSRILQH